MLRIARILFQKNAQKTLFLSCHFDLKKPVIRTSDLFRDIEVLNLQEIKTTSKKGRTLKFEINSSQITEDISEKIDQDKEFHILGYWAKISSEFQIPEDNNNNISRRPYKELTLDERREIKREKRKRSLANSRARLTKKNRSLYKY